MSGLKRFDFMRADGHNAHVDSHSIIVRGATSAAFIHTFVYTLKSYKMAFVSSLNDFLRKFFIFTHVYRIHFTQFNNVTNDKFVTTKLLNLLLHLIKCFLVSLFLTKSITS